MKTLLKKLFTKPRDPETTLYDGHPYKESFERFYDIIVKHLKIRDNLDNRLISSVYDPLPSWVVDMCSDLLLEFDSNDDILIEDIFELDQYCLGSIDYVRKFALRLSELKHSNL